MESNILIYPLLHMLFLESLTIQVYDVKEVYLRKRKTPTMNGFEDNVGNGIFIYLVMSKFSIFHNVFNSDLLQSVILLHKHLY